MSKKLQPVIVRTPSAGVHFGYLVSRKGQEVTLTKSRRIWYWKGAMTLSEIAINGLNSRESKIAVEVDIILPLAIEVISCTPASVKSINAAKWGGQ